MTDIETIFTEPHNVLVQRIQDQYPDYDIEPIWNEVLLTQGKEPSTSLTGPRLLDIDKAIGSDPLIGFVDYPIVPEKEEE